MSTLPTLVGLVAGLLFGLGLTISGMINPEKVLDFLDVMGKWDPSLAFVMLGAIPVAALGFAVGRRRQRPVCEMSFAQPPTQPIDRRLLTGAALFGLGWGLVGYCPGPAVATLALGQWQAVVTVLAMLAGMAVFPWTSAGARAP